MTDLLDLDALIGFGKPASKTADWIVNTYLPNAPVSYRLSIEHAIATAIIEASSGKHASSHAGEQGWVMVPREPTEAMSDAGRLILKGGADMFERQRAIACYKGMLRAAASPPQEGEK